LIKTVGYAQAWQVPQMLSLNTWPVSANLDLVRSIFAAWEQGDFSSAEWADAEIEYIIADGPAPGRWTGLAGMAVGFRTWLSAWEDFHVIAEDYRELDHARLLVLASNAGSGKASGVEIGQIFPKGAALFHIRDGKVTRLVSYWERHHALADLGLVQEADAAGSP
jgi:ketosteroid isomerase-like protein